MIRSKEVLTPAASYDLVLLSDAKTELGIADTASDTYLTRAIAAESARISTYCNRVFQSEGMRDTFFLGDSPALKYLILSRPNVTAVSSIVVDGETLDSSEYLAPVDGHYARVSTEGDNLIPWCGDKIVVTYTAGYTSIPAAVQEACLQLIKGRFYARYRDPAIKSEQAQGVFSTSYATGGTLDSALLPDVAALLDPYRLLVAV